MSEKTGQTEAAPRIIVREAVAIFRTEATLLAAIDDLLGVGFDRSDLSLLAGESTVRAQLGHRLRKVTDLRDDPNTPRIVYVAPEDRGGAEGGLIGTLLYVGAAAAAGAVLMSGGALAATVAAAAIGGGAGTAIGTAFAGLVGRHHAQFIQDQIDHGGLLLWVRLWNAAKEKEAVEILGRHSGLDVHIHDISALPEKQFDPLPDDGPLPPEAA